MLSPQIAAAAERQSGLVTRRQLLAAHMTTSELRRAIREHLLVPRGRGVYGLTGADEAVDVAAVVAARRGVLSHESAALWHGLELAHEVTGQVWLTVPRSRGQSIRRADGIRAHRGDLRPDQVVSVRGVRVTSVVRTLLDLARSLPLAHAVAAADSALRLHLVTVNALAEAAEALPRGPGRRAARTVAALADPQSGSVLESLLRVLLWENGVPAPQTQYLFRPSRGTSFRADFAWPEVRLLVEADGFEFHSKRGEYRRDRRRANAIARQRWWMLRFTWEDVVHDPTYVVAAVRAMLAERPTSGDDSTGRTLAPAA